MKNQIITIFSLVSVILTKFEVKKDVITQNADA